MKIPTGIPGFDQILKGGLDKGWSYLIKGEPGTGKTTFGLQFLLNGERSVYISFDEIHDEVRLQAENFGWDIDSIHFVDKVKDMDILSGSVLFYDYDSIVDITELIESITKLKELESVERVFIDGIGVLKDVTKDDSIYRRILSSIVNFLNSIGATTIISAEMMHGVGKDIISYLVSGEFVLRRVKRRDGRVLRTIEVLKYRGGDAYLGEHYFSITGNGIVVHPIIPVYKPKKYEINLFSTGNAELDRMLGGGIYKGSKVYIAGKTGVGKTSLCLQILKENDERGNVGILYAFDESRDIILRKYKEVFGYEPKKLIIRELSDASLGEFYNMVVEDIRLGPEVIAIDPLNAVDEMALSTAEFISALSLLKEQLEALGITFIGTYEIAQPVFEFHFTGAGMSRFADYLIVGRHMEVEGELLKTIAVIKNRFGNHERTIRVLDIVDGEGLKIGEPLKEYRGLMSGVIQKAE
jgi:circadian clock protein KaiC